MDDQHLDDQQRQHILDPAKILAGGVAAPLGALLTSHFGVAGTMLGLAFSAVIVTTISDILKAYFKRAQGAVKTIPGSSRARFSWKNFRHRVTAPFSWFLSLGPSRRRAMLLSGLLAGVIAFLIGTSAVTALEVGVGENLSCWVWNECPTTDSSTGEEASNTSTLPSILGGGQSAVSSNTPQEGQQQQQGQTSGTPTAKTPASSQSGQEHTPSGAPQEQQQSLPTRVVEEQQQSSSGPAGEQQSDSSTMVTEEPQQSLPSVPDSGVEGGQDNVNLPQE